MTLFELYLISILPNIQILFGMLTLVAIAFGLILFVEHSMEKACRSGGWRNDEPHPLSWKILAAVLALGFLTAAIPDERQLYTIAGAYVVTNTEGVKELPDNVMKAVNDFLESISESDTKE